MVPHVHNFSYMGSEVVLWFEASLGKKVSEIPFQPIVEHSGKCLLSKPCRKPRHKHESFSKNKRKKTE
jgi:hypothetical protein